MRGSTDHEGDCRELGRDAQKRPGAEQCCGLQASHQQRREDHEGNVPQNARQTALGQRIAARCRRVAPLRALPAHMSHTKKSDRCTYSSKTAMPLSSSFCRIISTLTQPAMATATNGTKPRISARMPTEMLGFSEYVRENLLK